MTIEEEIKELLTISPIQRAGEGKPVSLEEIASKFNLPLSVVQDMNDEFGYYNVDKEEKSKRGRPVKYNPGKYLISEMEAIDVALIGKAKAGNVKAIEQFNKMLDKITGKEGKRDDTLTPQDIYRRNIEAERDLRQMGYRVKRADGQVLENESI